MQLGDLLLLILGCVGFSFAVVNKLPDRLYEGDGFLAKMLQCAFCAGSEVGWWFGSLAAAGLLYGSDAVAWISRLILLGPAVGVLAAFFQAIGTGVAALKRIAAVAEALTEIDLSRRR